jgi:hypothetical protein
LRSHRRMRSRRSEARRRPKSSMPARCRRRQSAQLNSGNSWPGYAPFIERPGVLQQARLEHFARRSAIRLSLVGTATRFPGTVPCRAHRRKQHCAPAHDPGCAIRAICSSAPSSAAATQAATVPIAQPQDAPRCCPTDLREANLLTASRANSCEDQSRHPKTNTTNLRIICRSLSISGSYPMYD